jgi:hypothetical protein
MIYYYAKIHRGETRLFVQTPNQKEVTNKLKAIPYVIYRINKKKRSSEIALKILNATQ